MQNLTLAFGSILCLALPAVFGWIPLWKAVAFHEGCTLLVALNSLKILFFARQRWYALSEPPRLCACLYLHKMGL